MNITNEIGFTSLLPIGLEESFSLLTNFLFDRRMLIGKDEVALRADFATGETEGFARNSYDLKGCSYFSLDCELANNGEPIGLVIGSFVKSSSCLIAGSFYGVSETNLFCTYHFCKSFVDALQPPYAYVGIECSGCPDVVGFYSNPDKNFLNYSVVRYGVYSVLKGPIGDFEVL